MEVDQASVAKASMKQIHFKTKGDGSFNRPPPPPSPLFLSLLQIGVLVDMSSNVCEKCLNVKL